MSRRRKINPALECGVGNTEEIARLREAIGWAPRLNSDRWHVLDPSKAEDFALILILQKCDWDACYNAPMWKPKKVVGRYGTRRRATRCLPFLAIPANSGPYITSRMVPGESGRQVCLNPRRILYAWVTPKLKTRNSVKPVKLGVDDQLYNHCGNKQCVNPLHCRVNELPPGRMAYLRELMHMKNLKHSDEYERKIIASWNAGMTYGELVKRYGEKRSYFKQLFERRRDITRVGKKFGAALTSRDGVIRYECAI